MAAANPGIDAAQLDALAAENNDLRKQLADVAEALAAAKEPVEVRVPVPDPAIIAELEQVRGCPC